MNQQSASGSHKSINCRHKKEKNKHKCINCKKCNFHDIKKGFNTHNANSKSCPIYEKELEQTKRKTCYDMNFFLESPVRA